MWQHRKERHRDLKWISTPGSVLLTALLLSGCSSVPDAANPMEWYKGAADWVSGDSPDGGVQPDKSVPKGDFPKVSSVPEAPRPSSPADREDLVEGLVSDRANAKYTEDMIRREATGRAAPRTAPVVKAAPVPAPQSAVPAPAAPRAAAAAPATPAPVASTPVAAAPLAPPPAAAPAPEKKAAAEKAAAGPVATRSVRAESAPVPMPSTEPPPPPPVRAAPAAAAPVKAAPPAVAAASETTQDAYQRRLAESAEQRVSSIQPVAPAPSYAAASPPGDDITLIPPSQGKVAAAGASFQVAAINFPSGSAELSVADRNALKDVVKLQRQNGGKLRVIGHSGGAGQADTAAVGDQVSQMMAGFDMSMKRANAVSKELMRQGVPGKAIFVSTQSAPVPAGSGNTEIFIEY